MYIYQLTLQEKIKAFHLCFVSSDFFQISKYQTTEITSLLPTVRQKFPLYFQQYLELFAAFQILYLLIPRFLAEHLTMFCRTLAGKHWAK